MTHSNEGTLRAAYAAFAQGDLNGYLQYCTDNITFRVPGKGKIAGMHTRNEFISPWVSGVIELTNGTFRETVNDVVANDHRGVVLATHEFERMAENSSMTLRIFTVLKTANLIRLRSIPLICIISMKHGVDREIKTCFA